jgi:hypothetical protein
MVPATAVRNGSMGRCLRILGVVLPQGLLVPTSRIEEAKFRGPGVCDDDPAVIKDQSVPKSEELILLRPVLHP